ncbi:helicase-exonuclease AddAB subunit AddB [Desulfuribacillus stibiiarsenatis]|uniref:ATP-dependent helicase/deoxyribonuclease subunit B n=1 Tax=Desulfuribacillus stibiiarsenatis TaxID=1390249 RepID=A0A1E5L5C3_9FIRM|nr:helicase-exonuclease AddAB subunit AddB [Desulfuribacillus stibiiarsenatis]OEH85362.1 helicase-exonuclease AddAB subunit AddB [Desulfuribacillus stibiiarsenatis]
MSLEFIVGRAGSGKTFTCLERIRQELRSHPQGAPILYIVPEQMTFQSEYALATTDGLKGMIRAQVYSFTRLAWKVLQETGGLSRQYIDGIGMQMLLRKLTEHHKHAFHMYGKVADQAGFIQQLEQMLVEMKRHCISTTQLENLLQQHKQTERKDQKLIDKLEDILLIYKDLEKEIHSKYIDSEDYLKLLAEKIVDSTYIADAEIIVDGFHSFTPQELFVLKALLTHAKKVSVALTLDQTYDDKLPTELHMFYGTAKTYQKIRSLAKQESVPVLPALWLDGSLGRHRENPQLQHLEKNYHRWPILPFSECKDSKASKVLKASINIAAAVNRRAEIEAVARDIIKKVRDEGYRYREIAIVTRNYEVYGDVLANIFKEYEIPIFIDQKKTMLNHPLIEFIRSSLETVTGNWKYDAIFRSVKTDFYLDFEQAMCKQKQREELDVLENYVLAKGISGSHRWNSEQPWRYAKKDSLESDIVYSLEDQQQEHLINIWRIRIATLLSNLENGLNKATLGKELCAALYQFLVELQVPEKIYTWQQEQEASGELVNARQHEQAWKSVVELLDQLVEIVGDQEVSLDLFVKMMESGIENLRFNLVPPALDQVLMANFDLSRLTNIRCTYIIGINEGVIPAKVKEDGMITEEEREYLKNTGLELAPSYRSRLMEEPFTIYNTLTSASDFLWISYPLADEEGKTLLPSSVISHCKELFPAIEEQFIVADPGEEVEERQLSYIVHPKPTISYLTNQLRQWKKGYTISPVWWDAYNWFASIGDLHDEKWKRAIDSLFYKNVESKLPHELIDKMYGKKIVASVSRMERYSACPFSQFLSHGLKVKEREIYKLQNPDIGRLFHEALKRVGQYIIEHGLRWADLSETECRELSERIVEQLAPKLQSEILLSSQRNQYILRKLKAVVSRATIIISQQAKGSGFSPKGFEVEFGPNVPIAFDPIALTKGHTMDLIGRIDRIDQAIVSGESLLRIVDYKSSMKALDLTELYYGLALQMITYLDVVVACSKHWLGEQAAPAGVLYFHVHNPLIQSNRPMTKEQLEQELYKSFRMKGYVLADPEVARAMDPSLADEGYVRSHIVPVALKKDGQFDSRSAVMSNMEFDALRKHVRETIQHIGNQLVDGNITITPYRLKQKTPCSYCPYPSICHFDCSLEENQYRILKPITDQQTLLEKLRGDSDDSSK